MDISETFDFTAPPEVVFNSLTDPDRAHRWLPSGVRAERPDGHVRDNQSWQGDWDVKLADIRVPVDLVYGDADQMVPLAHAHRLVELVPGARLHLLPGAGHGYATFGSADLALTLLAAAENL